MAPTALSSTQYKVRDRLLEDVGALPVLPTVAGRLLGLSPNQDDYFEKVTEIIAQDPGFTVKLLAVANSAANRGVAQVKTIPDAVMRLGARGVANLIIAMGVVSNFPPKQPFEDALWKHSFEVAQVARVLARATKDKSVNPDELYLAGLLHDIGRFLLAPEITDPLSVAGEGEWPNIAELLASEVDSCGIDHAELGAIACDQWGMPIEISRVVRCHHKAEADIPAEFARVVRVLQAADEIVFTLGVPKSPAPDTVDTKVLGRLLEKVWPSWSKADPWDQCDAVREAFSLSRKSADAMGLRF